MEASCLMSKRALWLPLLLPCLSHLEDGNLEVGQKWLSEIGCHDQRNRLSHFKEMHTGNFQDHLSGGNVSRH